MVETLLLKSPYNISCIFFSAAFGGLASGCPRFSGWHDSTDIFSTTQRGAVRCCSFDGGSCTSKLNTHCLTLTFSIAEWKCSKLGMRLCTEEELASNICCYTGCGFDKELVWYTKGNMILLNYQLLSKLSLMYIVHSCKEFTKLVLKLNHEMRGPLVICSF